MKEKRIMISILFITIFIFMACSYHATNDTEMDRFTLSEEDREETATSEMDRFTLSEEDREETAISEMDHLTLSEEERVETETITTMEIDSSTLAEEDIQRIAPYGDQETLSWQESYAAYLRENHSIRRTDGLTSGYDDFFIFDIEKDDIPELFVINNYDELIIIYKYENNALTSITYNEEELSLLALFRGAAMSCIGPAPDHLSGFAIVWWGPSAGSFGKDTDLQRVIIENNRLVIADHIKHDVDVKALHELFDNFGYDADDDELSIAIEEHSYIYINGVVVTEEEHDDYIGSDFVATRFILYTVNEDHINDLIFTSALPVASNR